MKLVYVVLEAQYQSALTQAVKNINSNRSNVCVEIVGYLLEELRDPSNYAAFTKDMEDANVFIGSLIFIEELADKVGGQPQLELLLITAPCLTPPLTCGWQPSMACLTPPNSIHDDYMNPLCLHAAATAA